MLNGLANKISVLAGKRGETLSAARLFRQSAIGLYALRAHASPNSRFDEVHRARRASGQRSARQARAPASNTHPTHAVIVRVMPGRVRCLRVCPTRGLVCLRAADPTCKHVSFYRCGSLFGMLFFVFTPFAI